MSNVTGIAIVIKAFLPAGKTLDEQFNALSLVKTAHETGDYAPLLAAAQIDEVKTEQKTRRVEDAATPEPAPDFSEVEGGEAETPFPARRTGSPESNGSTSTEAPEAPELDEGSDELSFDPETVAEVIQDLDGALAPLDEPIEEEPKRRRTAR